MNYMKQIAQMLGVELKEEFYLKGVIDRKYKITNDGVFFRSKKDGSWLITSWTLNKVLNGELEIIKKPILDEAEKEYLSNVIKPFRNKIESIAKYIDEDEEYISLIYRDLSDKTFAMAFPSFKKRTMYKGMKLEKRYTLEDLEL